MTTKLYFSLSSNPGNFGSTFYNKIFKLANFNGAYHALKCNDNEDFFKKVNALWDINASGISVSMPFKSIARSYKNTVAGDSAAFYLNNCNTIIPSKNMFYNTDYYGIKNSIQINKNKKIFAIIIGNGAMAETYKYYLSTLTCKSLNIITFDKKVINKNIIFHNLKEYENSDYKILINASPIGMPHVDAKNIKLINEYYISKFDHIVDSVVSKSNTDLISISEYLGKQATKGITIYKNQFKKQFELYTGICPSQEWIDEAELGIK